MASFNKPWMMFVDGENLTMRAQDLAAKQEIDLTDDSVFKCYKKNTFFWPSMPGPPFHLWADVSVNTTNLAERCYYYTSVRGDEQAVDEVHDELARNGFSPVLLPRRANQRQSKGVDISLTKDMLVQAFLGNYDVAVLVAGDADFCPVVEEIKRLGKHVSVAFFGKEDGLNPKLLRAADRFQQLQLVSRAGLTPRKLVTPPRKATLSVHLDPALKAQLDKLAQLRTPQRGVAEEVVAALIRYVEEEERSLPPSATL